MKGGANTQKPYSLYEWIVDFVVWWPCLATEFVRQQILNKHLIITSIFLIITVAHLKSRYGPPVEKLCPSWAQQQNKCDSKTNNCNQKLALLDLRLAYARGRQPLARVPQVARERIFYGTPSDLTCMRNLPYKRARRTPKLKLSTLHEINSPKICQACNSLDNFYVGDVCCGSANDTHNWLAVKAKKLAQDNPVHAMSH